MIWGAAFVAQSVGMDYLEPFTFQASRCFLGSLVLLPVIAVMDRRGVSRRPVTAEAKKQQLYFGLACGVIIFAACSLQQWGLLYTTPGKSGFLTSLYIILVPMAGLLFGRRVKPWVWGSVVLAVLGLYLLCGSTDFSLGAGELLTLGSAVAFCFHILVIDRASSQVDGRRLPRHPARHPFPRMPLPPGGQHREKNKSLYGGGTRHRPKERDVLP